MTTDTFDYTGYYTIVLTEHNDDYQITKIFEDFWSIYITNTNVLVPTDDYKTVLLYTYFPYTAVHCEKVVAVVQDYFENHNFTRNAPIFPDKMSNMHKCPVRVAMYHFEPFTMLKRQPNASYFIDGIEGIVFRVISQRLNFTPIVILSRTNILRNITDEHAEIQSPVRRSLDVVNKNISIQIAYNSFKSIHNFTGFIWRCKLDTWCYHYCRKSGKKVFNVGCIFLWFIALCHSIRQILFVI